MIKIAKSGENNTISNFTIDANSVTERAIFFSFNDDHSLPRSCNVVSNGEIIGQNLGTLVRADAHVNHEAIDLKSSVNNIRFKNGETVSDSNTRNILLSTANGVALSDIQCSTGNTISVTGNIVNRVENVTSEQEIVTVTGTGAVVGSRLRDITSNDFEQLHIHGEKLNHNVTTSTSLVSFDFPSVTVNSTNYLILKALDKLTIDFAGEVQGTNGEKYMTADLGNDAFPITIPASYEGSVIFHFELMVRANETARLQGYLIYNDTVQNFTETGGFGANFRLLAHVANASDNIDLQWTIKPERLLH